MRIDLGTGVVLAMALVFYVRFVWLRRAISERRRRRVEMDPESTLPQEAVRFGSTFFVGVGILLLVGGAFLNVSAGLPPGLQAQWWIPMALGLLLLILSIR